MKDRLQLLREAKQIAYEMVDMSSALSDERLAEHRRNNLTDQEIIAVLVEDFLDEATYYYGGIKDNYADEE